MPASTAAAKIQNGVSASERHGNASWIVQPKKARLITPVSTSERQRPDASPIDGRQHSEHRGFPKQESPDLRRAPADGSQNRQLARTFRDQNRQGQKNSGDRDDDRDRPQDVSHREGLIEDFENARAQRPVRVDHELAVAAELLLEKPRSALPPEPVFLQVNSDAVHAVVVPESDESSAALM